MPPSSIFLPWLQKHESFPSATQAWGVGTAAPGLLAAGGSLDAQTLFDAYRHGIFPWFREGQPILWWSPDPRMTLHTREFRLHKSLRKVIKNFRNLPGAEIRVDHDFAAVIDACSVSPREGQNGTWIVPEIKAAYLELHHLGHAHSVETWHNGVLTGGLYCVSIGKAVFGESMFARRTDASKIALAALVGMTVAQGVHWIDCQQVTDHLAFMGGRQIERSIFLNSLLEATSQSEIEWKFQPLYWDRLLSACANPT